MILLGLLTFMLCAGVRLLDLPLWQSPEFQLAGERFAANPDTYGWLAGAERINHHSGSFLAMILRFVQAATGFKMGNIAFWLPVILASLTALPIFMAAVWWGLPEAACLSGVMAGASLGYLARTRMGCLDTDVPAVLLPACLASLLLIWVESFIRKPWGREKKPAPGRTFLMAWFAGLIVQGYAWSYESGEPVALAIVAAGLLPALILCEKGQRLITASAFLTVFLAGSGGWPGLAVSSLVVLLAFWRPALFQEGKRPYIVFIVLLLGVSFCAGPVEKFFYGLGHVGRYGQRFSQETSIRLPPVIATVKEAGLPEPHVVFESMAGHWILFLIGLAGFFYLLRKRPCAFVFAPFLLLGLAGIKLGLRFCMYGGIPMGLGLGVGLAMILKDLRVPGLPRWLYQAAVLIGVFWITGNVLLTHKLPPVISTAYAQALREMKEKSPADARLWVWWDQGYAVQYYAGKMTFADGSRNSGEYIVPLSRIYAADSAGYAHGLITFTALAQAAAGPEMQWGSKIPILPNPFLSFFHKLKPVDARRLMEDVGNRPLPPSDHLPEQYLIVSLETLRLADLICDLGTWDVAQGVSKPGKLLYVPGDIEIDLRLGILRQDDRSTELNSFDEISGDGIKHLSWRQKEEGWSLLIDKINETAFVVDKKIYDSLAVQMLIAEPERFRPYFHLVVDRTPYLRIYRLNPLPSS